MRCTHRKIHSIQNIQNSNYIEEIDSLIKRNIVDSHLSSIDQLWAFDRMEGFNNYNILERNK
jgi:hypothetical protein